MNAQQIEKIGENLQSSIRKMKKRGTTGCSLDNLMAVTSTKGVNCHVADYRSSFPVLASLVAKAMNFQILKEEA